MECLPAFIQNAATIVTVKTGQHGLHPTNGEDNLQTDYVAHELQAERTVGVGHGVTLDTHH